MIHHSLAFAFATSILALAACKSSSSSGATTATTAGAGGSGGAATGSGGAATGGGGATTGAGGGGGASTSTGSGGGCHGDAATWKALTAGPFPCTKSSDCCVIVNGCTNAAQIVGAKDEAAAKAAWSYCDAQCTACIPPAIEVGCNEGQCAGRVVDFADASSDLLQDHCGVDPSVLTQTSKLLFSCGDQ